MKRYVIDMVGGIEPVLVGPFKTERQRDREARRLFREDGEGGDDVVIRANVKDGRLEVDTYPGWFAIEAQKANRDDAPIFEGWTDTCPNCGDRCCLTVVEAKLAATGEVISPNTLLCPDGFDVKGAPDELEDHSTKDEKVQCARCRAAFALSDAKLRGPDS